MIRIDPAVFVHRLAFCLTASLLLLSGCGDGPTEPLPAAIGTSIVILPGAILFADAGSVQSLEAYSIDADGDTTLVDATFESSDPGVVSIGAGNMATAGATLGSAQIVARSGELTSAPILVLRATPAAGALLVADSQVIGPVLPVDPAAPYGVGRETRVRLRGAAPAVGQLIIGMGGAPVGGRVMSASTVAGDTEVVLALVPLGELFADISIDQRLPLTGAISTESSQNRSGVRLTRTASGGTRFAAAPGARFQASASRTVATAGRIEQEFNLGPFKCKLEVPAPIVVPITMSTFSGELNESLALDLVVESGVVRRFVVDGSIRPTLTVMPRITAALEGKAECKYKVREFPLPVGGLLSLFFGGQVPLGIGFELGAKTTLGQLGADVTFTSAIAAQLGFDCTAACQWVQGFDAAAPDITVKPVIPDLGNSTRLEMGVSAFGWADLTLGLTLWEDETTRLKLLGAKLGLEQKFELASAEAQAADPAYASSYSLKPAVEVKAGAEYTPLENLLQVTLTLFTYAPELPAISQSPRGTFSITPSSVAAGDDTEIGELATFTVTLPAATYFGAYAIEGVQIRWRRTFAETVVLESGRPGCTDLEAAQDQLTFTCQTDFLAEHAGAQTFYAFLKTRIWGVPVPVPLEVAVDGKATVTITGGAVSVTPSVVTLSAGQTQEFTASIAGGGSQAVTWSGTGGTFSVAGNTLTYVAGGTPGTFAVTATNAANPAISATASVTIEPEAAITFRSAEGSLRVASYEAPHCDLRPALAATIALAGGLPPTTCTTGLPSSTATAEAAYSISSASGNSMTISISGRGALSGNHVGEHNVFIRVAFAVTGRSVQYNLSGSAAGTVSTQSRFGLPEFLTVNVGIGSNGSTFIQHFIRLQNGDPDETLQTTDAGELQPGEYLLAATIQGVEVNSTGDFNVTLQLGP